jgi:hypothetical protein
MTDSEKLIEALKVMAEKRAYIMRPKYFNDLHDHPNRLARDNEIRSLFDYDPNSGDIRWKIDRGTRFKKGMLAGTVLNGYVRTITRLSATGKKFVCMNHTLAWFLYYGKWPEERIDHINGIRGDNRISNLRDVNKWENNANREIHRDGKNPGYSWNDKERRFGASIQIDGVRISLGNFKEEGEAAAVHRGARIVVDQFYYPLFKKYRTLFFQMDTLARLRAKLNLGDG